MSIVRTYCLAVVVEIAIEAHVEIVAPVSSLITNDFVPQRSFTVLDASTLSAGMLKVAVAVFPSATVIEVGEKTMLSIVALVQGLVTTTSNVTSGTTPVPDKERVLYPCPEAMVKVVAMVTV